MSAPSAPRKPSRLRTLTDEYLKLAATLRQGGGPKRVAKMHEQGRLSPRERVEQLLDRDSPWLELGLLVAYDQYDGQAPGAGVITGLGIVEGREVVIVANDSTVKAGSWWPETIKKMLRAQEVAKLPWSLQQPFYVPKNGELPESSTLVPPTATPP